MAGKTEIDFNADYLFDKNGDNTIQREESSNKEDRVVTSTNTLRSELFCCQTGAEPSAAWRKCPDRG